MSKLCLLLLQYFSRNSLHFFQNPKICEFPSQQFYEGKLRTGPEGRWIVDEPLKIWRDPRIPLLFCHIEGEEETQAVDTEEGNQQSRRNRAEVDHVVGILFVTTVFNKSNNEMRHCV